MSLILINGQNPFQGQRDPYLSMDSTISYQDNPNGDIQNIYNLEGALTGCDKNTLNNLRDDLVRSFDWKEDPTIPANIEISGVISSNSNHRLIPTSINFDNSNYIGALSYQITIESFTGFNQDSSEDQLINKTHTVTTDIDENECVSISTNIGCSPNQNLTGCNSIEIAKEWIEEQLGVVKIGQVTLESQYPLKNESLSINPFTSEVNYSSSHGFECDKEEKDEVPGISGLQIAHCIESENTDPECGKSIAIERHQGEVYKKDADEQELLQYLKDEVLLKYPNINELNTTYSAQEDNITFSFNVGSEEGEKHGSVTNDYSITTNTDHDTGEVTISINGSYSQQNSKTSGKSKALSIPDQTIQNTAQTNAGAGRGILTSKSITRNPTEGTVSYSFSYKIPVNGSQTTNSLAGISGLNSYSISVKEPLKQYAIVQVLNCPDKIIDLGYCSDGETTVNMTYESGANQQANNFGINLAKTNAGANGTVTQDSTSVNNNAVTTTYTVSYQAQNC